MTAGRGIVHCEMPHGTKEGHGLQLWVNLKKTDKMVEPKYQELLAKDIPTATKDGVKVKVIAGEAFGIKVIQFNKILYMLVILFYYMCNYIAIICISIFIDRKGKK